MPKQVEKIVKALRREHPEYPISRDYAIAFAAYNKKHRRK